MAKEFRKIKSSVGVTSVSRSKLNEAARSVVQSPAKSISGKVSPYHKSGAAPGAAKHSTVTKGSASPGALDLGKHSAIRSPDTKPSAKRSKA